MGRAVFNNHIFENWLDKKADDILSKVDREKISTEEMIILILKAQTKHFDHMDLEIKSELQRVDQKIEHINADLGNRMSIIDKKIDSRFMWTIGLTAAGFSGLYLKLFFV